MTKWLASIQSIDEAKMLSSMLPSILDMKNPSEGALGGMVDEDIRMIVDMVAGKCLTSATIGDLPMNAELIAERMLMVANTGVDYVKIGIFPDENLAACIDELALTINKNNLTVIAVMFADNLPKQNMVSLLQQANFKGVMIDTAFKNGKTLRDHWSDQQIETFVKEVKHHHLLCGLAGALRTDDVTDLKKFGAHYLGFRSALCDGSQRENTISCELTQKLRKCFLK